MSMSDSAKKPAIAWMSIPSLRTGIPMFIFTVLVSSFVLFFVAVSIVNLYFYYAMAFLQILGSITWLAVVLMLVWAFIYYEGGIVQNTVVYLGHYSRQQFIEAITLEGDGVTLCYGYRLFGRKLYYLRVETSAIVSVDWSTGQATHMAGRDMNDWSIWMWYFNADNPDRSTDLGLRRNHDLYMVGPTRSRDKTELLGHQFVEFLRTIGLDMVATEKDTVFNVRGKSLPPHQQNQ